MPGGATANSPDLGGRLRRRSPGNPKLTGCRLAGLAGDTLVATEELDLSASTFTGPLLLPGADITGQLSLHRAPSLTGADSDGDARFADGMKVDCFPRGMSRPCRHIGSHPLAEIGGTDALRCVELYQACRGGPL
jgi:hypothetical protein